MNIFKSGSGSSAGAPAPDPTVLPPVPVTGSYLTSILLDEFSKPIAQADVLAVAGQFSTRTSDTGVFALPVRLLKDSAVALDVKANGQTLFINVQLPIDIADAVRSVDPAAGIEVPRTMGIRIAGYQAPPPEAPSNRFPVVTVSLPPQTAQAVVASAPLLVFAVTSHKNGDAVPRAITLAGTCDSGQQIKVSGDLNQPFDSACPLSGSSGTFQVNVTLTDPDGTKSLTLTQTDPVTGRYVSQLLLLNSVTPPVAPSLTVANVTGLKPILNGTCDSSAASHTATTTVGSVRSVTCTNGVLSVLVHLPAGSASFSVTATSTKNSINSSSSAVTVTRTAFTCPSGYVGVPAGGVAGLGNTSASANNSAANSNANWWLDVNRDFCVMKYPAKNNGSNVAVSTTAGAPWVSITRDSSLTTCAAVGSNYRLISNTQWQTVARNAESVAANWSGNAVGSGVMARGHTDNSPANALANSTDDDPYFGTGNSGAAWNTLGATPAAGTEQKRTQTLSNGEVIWDFAGNVWQWVSDDRSALGIPAADDTAGMSTNAWYSYLNGASNRFSATGNLIFGNLGSGGIQFSEAQNIGRMYGGSAGAVLRGGGWLDASGAGLFTALLDAGASDSSYIIGFRCVFLP